MKTQTKKVAGAILGVMAVGVTLAGNIPFHDGFETYVVGMALDGTNGWGATDGTVTVQTNVVWSPSLGTNAAILLPSKTVSNQQVSLFRTNVWSDLYMTNSISMPVGAVGADTVDPTMTVQWFIETNGYPVVWNRTNVGGSGVWLVCSNDFWKTNTAVFNTNEWMRFTLCRNYGNQTAALFLNQHLLLQQLPFIDASQTNSSLFQLVGGASVTSYFDEVSSLYAPSNFTADLDNDGVCDADEIQTLGNITTIRRLTITGARTNLTDGDTGGGWLDSPAANPFEVAWTNGSTNLHWNASNEFYAADLLTNGVSVGHFDGRLTNYAAYTWINNHADATVRVAFARMPVITASNSVYGSITPASTNAYIGESRAFTFQATNSHYFISGVRTNGQAVGTASYSGQGTNSGSYTWANIAANGGIEVQYAHKYTNATTVVTIGGPGEAGGTVSASVQEVYPGEAVTFMLTPAKAYGVTALTNNGALAATFGGSLVAVSNDITGVQAHLNVQAVFTYTARRRVPEDYSTLDLARAAAVPGDTIVVTGGSTAGGMTLSNMTLIATNTLMSGGLTVTTGMLASCTGLTAASTTVNGLLVVSNGTVDLGTLVFGGGATVQVVNATSFTADGVTFKGSVRLDENWKSALVSRTPPFSDGFEDYATNTALRQLGHFGWGASDAGVVVQGAVYTQGVKAVEMPVSTILSNSLAPAAASNVWVEWRYREQDRIDETLVKMAGPRTNMTILLFVNTQGYMTVYDADMPGYRVLSNDVWGREVPSLATSDWPRVAVNMNYQRRRAALLLNGRLLVQQLRFINTNQDNCAQLEWDAGMTGPTYLDDVNVWTNAASVVSLDADGDGIVDALEIEHCGDIFAWPRGSVFLIR